MSNFCSELKYRVHIVSTMVVCRLCCAEVRQNHSVSLRSPPSLKTDLPARLSRLVEVSDEEEVVYVSASTKHTRISYLFREEVAKR